MGSLDENGIYIYDETDQISPIHTYSNMGQASTSAALEYVHEHTLIMPVANAAERNAYASDMAAAGRPASPSRPLWVERADTGEVERNRGTGWVPLIDSRTKTHVPNTSNTAWQRNNLLVKKNGWVSLRIRQKRIGPPWTGSATIIEPGQIPPEFRTPHQVVTTATVYLRNDIHRTLLLTINTSGEVVANQMRIVTGNWLNAHATWATDD